MSYEWRNESETPVLLCSGELGPIECGELRTELLSAMDAQHDFAIDLAGVNEAGTIFVQLMISARAAAEAKGVAVTVINPSEIASTAFRRISVEMGG